MIREEIFRMIKYKRIKIKDLAKFVGCSAGLLYQYKKGKTNLSEDLLNRVIKSLDLRIVLIDNN